MRVVTDEAFTTPDVLVLTRFSTEAARVVSLSVTASSPRLLMPPTVYVVFTSAARPVRVPTVVASMIPVVLPSSVFRSAAAKVVSLIVTASSPRPAMPEAPVELYEAVTAAVVPVRVVTDAALI